MRRKGILSGKRAINSRIGSRIGYALILGLCATYIIGFACLRQQRDVASKMIRLHVIPNSDSVTDQSLKKAVRNNVNRQVGDLLDDVSEISEAEEILSKNIEIIEESAREVLLREGYTYPIRAELKNEVFSTREYDTFTLPAGEYKSLRVTIGDGNGQNWWCVVFPPLCFAGAVEFQDTAEAAGLTIDEINLISEQSEENVVFRFQILELIKKIADFLQASKH